jgi:ABC-type bacteriocin/lantibiotic exporter with double-glycine peptidase domain
MPASSIIDSIIELLIAVVMIYVGAVILYNLNPVFGILFVLLALYILFRTVSKGKGLGL